MTVDVNDAVDDYLAVGGETDFSYTFPVSTVISPALHALVVETRVGGVLTTLVEGVDYTVTGAGQPLGGTALLDTGVFPVGAIAGVTWTLKRLNPLARATDFQTSGDFFATEVNLQLDLLTQIVQDQKRDIDANFAQSIRLDVGSLATINAMADPINGTFLRAAAGDKFDWVTIAEVGAAAGVDETDTNADKDKLTSNALVKRAEDLALAINGVQAAVAVNQFQATNSAAGNNLKLEATGADDDISMEFTPKGTGKFKVNNLALKGNTLSSEDTNGDLNIVPDGSGNLVLDSVKWPQADGSPGQLLSTNGSAQLAWIPNTIVTGAVISFIGTTAPSSWILLDGGTIGNGSSGGTTRANADTEVLFALFWDSMADAQAAVSSGRGGSAAADFAADKTITISDLRGRSIFGTGGTAPATHGDNGGVETQTLTIANSSSHNHLARQTVTTPSSIGAFAVPVAFDTNAATVNLKNVNEASGSGTAHNNMSPFVALNYIIKL